MSSASRRRGWGWSGAWGAGAISRPWARCSPPTPPAGWWWGSRSTCAAPRARVRAFAERAAAHLALPLEFWDERLTTVAAERALLEADVSRRRRREVVDKVAATLILQGYLARRP